MPPGASMMASDCTMRSEAVPTPRTADRVLATSASRRTQRASVSSADQQVCLLGKKVTKLNDQRGFEAQSWSVASNFYEVCRRRYR